MNISLDERAKRLDLITAHTALENTYTLLKEIAVSDNHLAQMKQALNLFLYANLTAGGGEVDLVDKLEDHYYPELINLPNLTPNGLILPKKENFEAYNVFHRACALAFRELQPDTVITHIQYPINIRLQQGIKKWDERPRASTKPHSDIWAGDPSAAIVVFLSLAGSTEDVGIRFLEPNVFPQRFAIELEDFNDGKYVVDQSKELSCQLKHNKWLLMDPYMIHQTTKSGSGFRISIDMRFTTNIQLDSDHLGAKTRQPFFIPYEQWMQIGNELELRTNESIKDPIKKFSKDYTVGYPVEIELVKVK